jgi:hypothetical protein
MASLVTIDARNSAHRATRLWMLGLAATYSPGIARISPQATTNDGLKNWKMRAPQLVASVLSDLNFIAGVPGDLEAAN